jgi:hypothetical protein
MPAAIASALSGGYPIGIRGTPQPAAGAARRALVAVVVEESAV